jgi:hypothetical protein
MAGSGRSWDFLDFYDNGRRWYEFLNLFLIGDRMHDKETMRLAVGILSQRRLDAATTQNALPSPSGMKADFIAYCKNMGESKAAENTRRVWRNAIDRLISFAGKDGIQRYCDAHMESVHYENNQPYNRFRLHSIPPRKKRRQAPMAALGWPAH